MHVIDMFGNGPFVTEADAVGSPRRRRTTPASSSTTLWRRNCWP
ncbi:hypothetical protein ACFQT0_18710 [Hymenobacter humi]|uniref:Uncharacterized protein n=1 Tax=Hymenobacter humi TaxID=1411620 RepID=A0ABW2U9K9_9BACT